MQRFLIVSTYIHTPIAHSTKHLNEGTNAPIWVGSMVAIHGGAPNGGLWGTTCMRGCGVYQTVNL